MENEVYDLRTNMLRLIRVRSFSDIVDWKDPCISLILPEVICKACNHTRDIDLCKDNQCVFEDDRYIWKCPLCETGYDNTEIEFQLIDMLNRKNMGYVLQDVQCCKCKEVKRENISSRCSCSGEFKTLVSSHEVVRFVKMCKSVAKKCDMKVLTEMAERMCQFVR